MHRLTTFIQGHQRVLFELKQPDAQKAFLQALKDLSLKKNAAATATSGIACTQDGQNDVMQGVQRQIHTTGKYRSCGQEFGKAYEPWSDDMACVLQGSCMPGSTRYCRTASMFSKMELSDIMQAIPRNSLANGRRGYHTSTVMPIWSVQCQRLNQVDLTGPILYGLRYYATEGPASESDMSEKPGQVSQRERLKRAVRDYGSTVIVFHVCISLMSLGAFYLAVSSGIDVASLLSSMGFSSDVIQSRIATGTSTFVMAYAVHKLFAPVRIGITLTCTPFIVRYLRGIGLLKRPIPAK